MIPSLGRRGQTCCRLRSTLKIEERLGMGICLASAAGRSAGRARPSQLPQRLGIRAILVIGIGCPLVVEFPPTSGPRPRIASTSYSVYASMRVLAFAPSSPYQGRSPFIRRGSSAAAPVPRAANLLKDVRRQSDVASQRLAIVRAKGVKLICLRVPRLPLPYSRHQSHCYLHVSGPV